MADVEDKKEEQKESKTEEKEKKSLVKKLLPWVVMIVVVGFCAGAGLGLGSILAGTSQEGEDEETKQTDQENVKKQNSEDTKESGGVWYYELDPVVANLNEPSVARYVSASLTLQISSDADEKEYGAVLDEKKPILTDWLTVYLAGLSLEETRGDNNLKTIQSQILEAFNEIMFKDSKPQIKQILFRAFAVQ